MSFAGAGSADEDRIALGVEEGAGGEFANLSFIDWRITLRTVARDTDNVRTISLIGRCCSK
jgi:hypothetical protein